LVFNDGLAADRLGLFGGDESNINQVSPIPMFALTFSIGLMLSQLPQLSISYSVSFDVKLFSTMNVLVDTPFGDANSVIDIGAHLDSVPAGPGINDDGSGSAFNLELATQLFNSKIETVNKIRFAWWAGEERGLLGSTYYVQNLNSTNQTALNQIAMNINFDMIGSPNYQVGLHNGILANNTMARNGSVIIQKKFEDIFNASNIPFKLIEFDGRSDYGPFLEVGIPAGGIFTGAEGTKQESEISLWGGIANVAYDPCYHLACDTVDNINQDIYLKMAQSGAGTLDYFANLEGLKSALK